MAKSAVEKIAALEAKAAEVKRLLADARKDARKEAGREARKADARRKIILGGILIDRAAKDPRTAEWIERMVQGIQRPQDKAAFEGWTVPKPAAEPTKAS
jgi:hypothetical protein